MYPVQFTVWPSKRRIESVQLPAASLWESEDDDGGVVLIHSVRGVSIEDWTPGPEDKTKIGWLRGVPDHAIAAGKFFAYGPIPEGTRFLVDRPHEIQRVMTTTLGGRMAELGIVEVCPVYVTDQLVLKQVLYPSPF